MVGIAAKKLFGDAEPPPEMKEAILQQVRGRIDIYKSAGWAYIDDVIDPRQTRRTLAWGLELAAKKHALRPNRKHGVIPV